MTTIYVITNKIDGKKYIGQTINFESRIYCHRNNSNNRLLREDIKKYGWENFETKALCEVDDDQADEAEYNEIKKHNALYPNGYNRTTGGCLGTKQCQAGNSSGRPKKERGDVEEIMNVYNIPKKWIEAIKEHQIPFSVYAKLAVEVKLQKDGWLKG